MPLTIYLGASLLSGPEDLRLRVSRILSSDRILEGWPVVVRLSVTDESSRLEEALIEDLVPKSVERIVGEPRRLVSLLPGPKVEYDHAVGGLRRGTYSFQDVRVVASDHLGLFRRQATLRHRVKSLCCRLSRSCDGCPYGRFVHALTPGQFPRDRADLGWIS